MRLAWKPVYEAGIMYLGKLELQVKNSRQTLLDLYHSDKKIKRSA